MNNFYMLKVTTKYTVAGSPAVDESVSWYHEAVICDGLNGVKKFFETNKLKTVSPTRAVSAPCERSGGLERIWQEYEAISPAIIKGEKRTKEERQEYRKRYRHEYYLSKTKTKRQQKKTSKDKDNE